MHNRNNDDSSSDWKAVAALALLILAATGLLFWGMPRYGVYRQQLSGQAKLREAESSRQIAVLEAKARLESATLQAQAEVERAKGVAAANQIIGESLQGEEGDRYLRYVYITGLQEQAGQEGDRTVIYIPTDGLVPLPISEAGRTLPATPARPALIDHPANTLTGEDK